MLSTKVITNAGVAAGYYNGQDNYYEKDSDEVRSLSEWWGKGAKAWSLSGPVTEGDFKRFLEGHLPNGQHLGIKVDDKIKHRAGFDLTFSAPKSVSLVALRGGDKRFLQAVVESAKVALSTIEKDFAEARVTKEGETTYVKTGNLVSALYLHDLSREGDPQLHVHAVVMNATQLSNGDWRSLSSQSGYYGVNAERKINGFIEQVRHYKKYLGAIFQSELAYRAKELNYDVDVNPKGYFEIRGISKESINAHSQRSKQIDDYMKEHGFSSAKAAAIANLNTRKKSQNIDRETIKECWKKRDDQMKVDTESEAKRVFEEAQSRQKSDSSQEKLRDNDSNPSSPSTARKAVLYALDHLTETQVKFREIDLINRAVKYSLGRGVNIAAIGHAINQLVKEECLIPLSDKSGEGFFTTKPLIQVEQENLRVALGQQTEKPLIPWEIVEAYLLHHEDSSTLSPATQKAFRQLASNEKTIMGLEGSFQTDRAILMKSLMDLAKMKKYETFFLMPTRASSEALKEQMTVHPHTLREFFKKLLDTHCYQSVPQFLSKQQWLLERGKGTSSKKMIFVDKAELLSSRQFYQLHRIAEQTQGRIILSGDSKAPLSWQTGSPYLQAIEKGMPTVKLTVSPNQSTASSSLKEAWRDTLSGNIAAAFEKIGNKIVSMSDESERIHLMSQHYAQLSSEDRGNTQVILPTQAQSEILNHAIHQRLRDNDTLKKGQMVSVLLPVFLPVADYPLANRYQKNQLIRFQENYPSLAIRKDQYYRIAEVHQRTNTIILMDEQGNSLSWNPNRAAGKCQGAVEVFREKNQEFSVGETISWKRHHREKALYKGEPLKIASIHENKMTLTRVNRKRVTVNLDKPASRHFDYGYAQTPNQARHIKADKIIAYQNSTSRQSHQREYYQLLSQAKESVWIYTDDRDALLHRVIKQTGDKVTAIETLLPGHDTEMKKDPAPPQVYLSLLIEAVKKAIIQEKIIYQKEKTPEEYAREAVDYALGHLSAREAAFEHKEVMEVALRFCLGGANTKLVTEIILAAQDRGELIKGIYSSNGTRWTTKEAVETERAIRAFIQQDRQQFDPIATPAEIEQHILETSTHESHREALKEFVNNTDRSIVIQGLAGTGKTTFLANLKPLIERTGHRFLCLAPTHKAVKELLDRGLEAQTLASFLGEHRSSSSKKPEKQTQEIKETKPIKTEKGIPEKLFIALDENSMTSNQAGLDFLRVVVRDFNARPIFLGDIKQLPAIEAGKPHYLSVAVGARTIYLKEIKRQKTDELKETVAAVYQNDFTKAFERLGKNITEIGLERVGTQFVDNPMVRMEAIRDRWLAKNDHQRANTQIICFSNNECDIQNALIREELKEEGSLIGKAEVFPILVECNMTEIEKTKARNYANGDVIRFGYTNSSLGIQKEDYLVVRDRDETKNLLVLEKEDGEKVVWKPTQVFEANTGIEIYQKQQCEVMVGDRIRWMKSDKKKDLLSPEVAFIEKIEGKVLHLQKKQLTDRGYQSIGEPFELDTSQKAHQHWNYGYVITAYKSQAGTYKEVIVNASSQHPLLTSQKTMLVSMTRPEYGLAIYTDSKEGLIEQLNKNSGDKTSALETIGELPDPTQSDQSKEKQGNHKAEKTKGCSSYVDAKEILSRLNENASMIVEKVLGHPKSRSGTDYQYSYSDHFGGEDGKREGGSFFVAVNGSKQGLWHCFKTGESGNLLQLIQKKCGLDFKQSLNYAAGILGISQELFLKENSSKNDPKTTHPDPFKREQNERNNSKQWTDHQKKMVCYAQKLSRESQPIQGTLAETYLRKHRGISGDFPENFRFHPAIYSKRNEAILPALLVVAHNSQNKVQAIQAIFLDEKTSNKASVEVKKQTWGVSAGIPIAIGKTQNPALTFIAEGPETALSILESLPGSDVRITLGKSNYRHVPLDKTADDIVLCLDNDGDNPQTKRLTQLSAERLKQQGKQVWLAMPNEKGKDYNDLLIEQGRGAIKANIEEAICYPDNERNEKNLRENESLRQKFENELLKKTDAFQTQKEHKIARELHECDKIILSNGSKTIPQKAMEKVIAETKTLLTDDLKLSSISEPLIQKSSLLFTRYTGDITDKAVQKFAESEHQKQRLEQNNGISPAKNLDQEFKKGFEKLKEIEREI